MREGTIKILFGDLFSDSGCFISSLPASIIKTASLQGFENQISLWIKIIYTLFVLALIPVYWKHWGPANFLWFSDVALFLSVGALWMESRLLVSTLAVGVLLPELYWNFELIVRLLTKKKLAGLTNYMFNTKYPLFLRLLSLFHVFLPVLLIYMLAEFGYDSDALYLQTGLAWIVLFLCYKLTPPSANINWVFGPGNSPQHKIPSKYYLLITMAAYPLLLFIPTHFILKVVFG